MGFAKNLRNSRRKRIPRDRRQQLLFVFDLVGHLAGEPVPAVAAKQVVAHFAPLEQAERLEETGAGIQLSPNATRILIALGLGERLRADAMVPAALAVAAAMDSVPKLTPILPVPSRPMVSKRFPANTPRALRGEA